MKKGSIVLGIVLMFLAIGCFVLFFLYNNKPKDYKVTFDSDGGSSVAEQIVKSGEKVIKPADPSKDKSDFIEWQLNGSTYDFESAVNSNITLKATWLEYNTFSVKVTLEGNEYVVDIRNGELLTLDAFGIPSKEGYDIKLYTEDEKEYDMTIQITNDLELIGKYVELPKYTITFDANGGSKVSDVKVYENLTVEEPSVTRDGYVLDGWYLNNEKYDFATPVTKNITLKAKWNEGTKYTVTFSVDDKTYKTSQVLENTKVSKPTDPTKSGYKFIEWQLDGKAFDFANTKITADITLTAKFDQITSYTVTFDSVGGTNVKAQQVEVGKKATEPANPTRNGYKFVEWQLNGSIYNFDSTVNSDITLKAKWKKVYTVTFDKNNGTNNDIQTVGEGETVTKPADPVKQDHDFVGWIYNNQIFDFSTPITKDITLTARYQPKTTGDIPGF